MDIYINNRIQILIVCTGSNDLCAHCHLEGSFEHAFLECPFFQENRKHLQDAILELYLQDKLEKQEKYPNMKLISIVDLKDLGTYLFPVDLKQEYRMKVLKQVIQFGMQCIYTNPPD